MNDNLSAALVYAAHGVKVFPLSPRSKVPLKGWHGHKDATDDLDTIRKWWTDKPDCGVAIATGEKSGIFVIDLDGDPGYARLHELVKKHGPLPKTVSCKSGNNGMHMYFKHPGYRVSNISDEKSPVHVRGDGGYVVGPPSIHPETGNSYAWQQHLSDIPIAEAPQWLLDIYAPRKKTPAEIHAEQNTRPPDGIEDMLFRWACRKGDDGASRHSIGIDLAQQCRHNRLSREETLSICLEFQQRYRCRYQGDRVYDRSEAIRSVDWVWETIKPGQPWKIHDGEVVEASTLTDESTLLESAKARKLAEPVGYRLSDLQHAVIDTPKFIVDNLFPVGLTILGAKPKLGKSRFMYAAAIDVTCGASLLRSSRFNVEHGTTLYIAFEDNRARMQDRARQLLDNPNHWPQDLYIYHTWPKIMSGGGAALDDWLSRHPGTRLVVIDTWTRFRNDKAKGQDPYQVDADQTAVMQEVAFKHNCAIVLVHHNKKSKSDDVTDNLSGSVGITASADAILVMQRMDRDTVTLDVTGRDLETTTYLLKEDGCRWVFAGVADEAIFVDDDGTQDCSAVLRHIFQQEPGPKPSKMVMDRVVRELGVSKQAVYKARKRAGIKSFLLNGVMMWGLSKPMTEQSA